MKSSKTVHLVCNAHLDPVWLWEWEEGAAEAISTFRVAADFCEDYDGFVFNHNEVILYQWIEEYEPELFERIKKLIAQDKWHIMGGWFLQPDCNMPSGESFVRQILLGRNYFREKFGKEPTTAINFDPFGHTRGLVQIMAKSGFDSYLFTRPSQKDCSLECDEFIWEGYDGSRVKAKRAFNGYLSHRGEAVNKIVDYIHKKFTCTKYEKYLKPTQEGTYYKYSNQNDGLLLWGIGNHGGGPSRIDMKNVNDFAKEQKKEGIDIIHSIPEDYFKKIDASKLPVHSEDLNKWAVGCYTSQIRIKQMHRKLENELYSTEKMLSSAWSQDLLKYPEDELKDAEQDLANSEFHDIIPGTSIQPVEETSLRLIDHGLEKLSRLKARAFFALSRDQKKAEEGEIPILVYNPHPYHVRTAVECEFNLPDQNWSGSFMDVKVFNNGVLLPCQVEKEYSNLHYLDWRKKVVFLADLKPSQINRFDCKLMELPKKPAIISDTADNFCFDNNTMSVKISSKTGLIDSYCVNGHEYIKSPSALPIVIDDDEDSWKMNEQKFGKRIGEFRLLSEEDSAFYSGSKRKKLTPVRIIEDGDARTIVEAVFGYKHSFLCIQYKILKQSSEIEISVRVNWSEKDKLLKFTFNPTGGNHDFFGQVAYGVEHYPTDGTEVLSQKWTAVQDKDSDHTLTIVDDSIYGVNFREGELGLTLLRSPAYSGHPFPGHANEMTAQDRFIPRIDQGERFYTFWMNGEKADDRLKKIDREALAKNEKPMAVSFFPAGLNVKKIKPILKLCDDTIQITAIKKSTQKEDALIVRLFEPTGKAGKTELLFSALDIKVKVELKPFEIKTLEINKKTKAVKEVNLIER